MLDLSVELMETLQISSKFSIPDQFSHYPKSHDFHCPCMGLLAKSDKRFWYKLTPINSHGYAYLLEKNEQQNKNQQITYVWLDKWMEITWSTWLRPTCVYHLDLASLWNFESVSRSHTFLFLLQVLPNPCTSPLHTFAAQPSSKSSSSKLLPIAVEKKRAD